MTSRLRVSVVLLGYFILWGLLLGIPAVLILMKTVPYRFEIALVLYVLVPVFLVIRNFVFGGGLSARLTSQINDIYGADLSEVRQRFVDLNCMSLLRIYGVWLVFPSGWLSNIMKETDSYLAYEATLDAWLAPSNLPPSKGIQGQLSIP